MKKAAGMSSGGLLSAVQVRTITLPRGTCGRLAVSRRRVERKRSKCSAARACGASASIANGSPDGIRWLSLASRSMSITARKAISVSAIPPSRAAGGIVVQLKFKVRVRLPPVVLVLAVLHHITGLPPSDVLAQRVRGAERSLSVDLELDRK
jgi:hypothetical protein